VPVHDKPAESLIGKAKPPLDVVQKGAGKRAAHSHHSPRGLRRKRPRPVR